MTPNFALSLSFQGITLLVRAAHVGGPASGWYVLGEVSLETDDLAGALADLRQSAMEDPSAEGPAVKLLLPNDQIKYLSEPRDATAPEAQAQTALDGATPYAVEDLAFDWEAKDGVLHIAAVARETLAEAEAFAKDHGFVPTSFVAIAPNDPFGREPYFGAVESFAGETPVGGDAAQVHILPGPPPEATKLAPDDAVAADNPACHARRHAGCTGQSRRRPAALRP